MKEPKTKPTTVKQAEVNATFLSNLERIRRWYHNASSGPDVGLNVNAEVALAAVIAAWENALDGKDWTPPAPSP